MKCLFIFYVLLSQNLVDSILDLDLNDYYSSYLEDPEMTQKHCVCVPFWQCNDDLSDLDTDIEIIDVRLHEPKSPSACTGYFDVCCKVECGRRESSIESAIMENRILGKNNRADFAEFPWMLGILKGQAYKCGASLIHPKVALTAAHCVQAKAKYTIRAGEWHWEHSNEPLPHQDREVESIITHPRFHPGSLRNDIALLILNAPFKLTKNVGIVCLPPRNLRVDIKRCVASGWGKNSFRKGSYQAVLKKVTLPIMPSSQCVTVLRDAMLGRTFTLHGSFICAGGEPNKDTCKGDGGGPLICPILGQNGRYEQIGIVSWGLTCGLSNTPGVYVNVMIFSEWIDTEMIRLDLDIDLYKYKY
ncbi:unnamed protein product [Ceutorhynchus assimilis]|uniref:Phenoloxidase-activating factor 2 n=1 Tax=Ceutorhynchus assimilis TaxID=467358 RepID=A0A9N9MVH4_9CUCU|nr:unnamed protein product [Ceutorhynchus assimilis]